MDDQRNVSVLWDCSARPKPGMSGFQVVSAIRAAAELLGSVKTFKLYTDGGLYDAPPPAFRSQVQCAGVTLVDTASAGQVGSVTKMILVDMFIYALDAHPTVNHTFLIISTDPDVCYGVSLLRQRGYRAYILSPRNSHPNLSQFEFDGEPDRSMLYDPEEARSRSPPSARRDPEIRATYRVRSSRSPTSKRVPVELIHDAHNPTSRSFQDDFAANVSLTGSDKRSRSSSPARETRSPSRSPSPNTHRSSSSSSSTSGEQVFETPRARVEPETEDDYVAITPPQTKSESAVSDKIDTTPDFRARSRSLSFSSPSGFFMVPPAVQSASAASLLSSKGSSLMSSPRLSTADSKVIQRPPSLEKSISTTSTATVKPPASVFEFIPRSHTPLPPLATRTPQPPTSISGLEGSGFQVKSFFPPPPLSPERTKNTTSTTLPITPPSTAPPTNSIAQKATPSPPFSSSISVGVGTNAPATPKPAAAKACGSLAAVPPKATFTPPQKEKSALAASVPAFVPASVSKAQAAPSAKPVPAPAAAKATSSPPSTAVKPPPVTVGQTPGGTGRFDSLIQLMKEWRRNGEKSVNRCQLGSELPKRQPDVYVRAGFPTVKPFKAFLNAAVAEKVVVEEGELMVALHPRFFLVPPHFEVLVAYMKEEKAKGEGVVKRSVLGEQLKKRRPTVYSDAGITNNGRPLKAYLDAAIEIGILKHESSEFVSLHPDYLP